MSASSAPNSTWDPAVRHSAAGEDLRWGWWWRVCLWWLRDVLSSEHYQGCLLDAAMAKIAQEGSRLKSRVKEKKPHELLFLTQTRTHKAIHVRAVAACLYDVARAQTGSVHTTSAGSLGNNSSVKMSDRLLTTHTLHHLSGKKHWTAHTDPHT